jgi:hypothetical protein
MVLLDEVLKQQSSDWRKKRIVIIVDLRIDRSGASRAGFQDRSAHGIPLSKSPESNPRSLRLEWDSRREKK